MPGFESASADEILEKQALAATVFAATALVSLALDLHATDVWSGIMTCPIAIIDW